MNAQRLHIITSDLSSYLSFVLHSPQDPFLSGWCCSSVAWWWWELSSFCSTSSLDLFKSCKCCHRSVLTELGHIFTTYSATVNIRSPQSNQIIQPSAVTELTAFMAPWHFPPLLLLRVVPLRPVHTVKSHQNRLWDFICFDHYQLFLIFCGFMFDSWRAQVHECLKGWDLFIGIFK